MYVRTNEQTSVSERVSVCVYLCMYVDVCACVSAYEVVHSWVERFARLRTFTRYCGDITREIAFQRQNLLKFTRKLARNSFSRFEGVNHGHTPGLA